MSCPFDHRTHIRGTFLSSLFVVPFASLADPRSVMSYRRLNACVTSIPIDPQQKLRGKRTCTGRKRKKKVPMCERRKRRIHMHIYTYSTHIHTKRNEERRDKLLWRRGFIRARYVTVIRDATRRESTNPRYFWATTPLSLDRQCANFPDLTKRSARAITRCCSETTGKKRERYRCGSGGTDREREREAFSDARMSPL